MEYIPTAANPQEGADKYYGAVASGYDAKREQALKWKLEQKIIEDMFDDLPVGTKVVDGPSGTGRFFDLYQRKGFNVLALDKSKDMLEQSIKKITKPDLFTLACGDIRNTGLPDNCTDVALNCRITRWLSPEDCQKMFAEMQRIATQRIIWTARVANHPHARSLELFEAALNGWGITHNIAGEDINYRILQARPI
jgi:ubiquinone/menaquinone biosynthesis C-methylase UbiE